LHGTTGVDGGRTSGARAESPAAERAFKAQFAEEAPSCALTSLFATRDAPRAPHARSGCLRPRRFSPLFDPVPPELRDVE